MTMTSARAPPRRITSSGAPTTTFARVSKRLRPDLGDLLLEALALGVHEIPGGYQIGPPGGRMPASELTRLERAHRAETSPPLSAARSHATSSACRECSEKSYGDQDPLKQQAMTRE